jgi:cytochrome c oxidase assembly factor CtaG
MLFTAACTLSIAIYLRGYLPLRRTRPALSAMRALSFCAGIVVLWLALASPLEELADTSLTAHMIEHLLLMSAVPPLLLAGWPVVPLLRGTPLWLRRPLLHPLLRSTSVRAAIHRLDSMILAWALMNLSLLAWHVPAAYDFALQNEHWHEFEHACFLLTSLLFWWVLLRPWPAAGRGDSGWMPIFYLVAADVINTALSATLAFVGHPVYGYYLTQKNALGLDSLTDQQTGAAIMWVFGSIAFLVPALILAGRLLSGPHSNQTGGTQSGRSL